MATMGSHTLTRMVVVEVMWKIWERLVQAEAKKSLNFFCPGLLKI